jgi:hypothetical protein
VRWIYSSIKQVPLAVWDPVQCLCSAYCVTGGYGCCREGTRHTGLTITQPWALKLCPSTHCLMQLIDDGMPSVFRHCQRLLCWFAPLCKHICRLGPHQRWLCQVDTVINDPMQSIRGSSVMTVIVSQTCCTSAYVQSLVMPICNLPQCGTVTRVVLPWGVKYDRLAAGNVYCVPVHH